MMSSKTLINIFLVLVVTSSVLGKAAAKKPVQTREEYLNIWKANCGTDKTSLKASLTHCAKANCYMTFDSGFDVTYFNKMNGAGCTSKPAVTAPKPAVVAPKPVVTCTKPVDPKPVVIKPDCSADVND
jgi:hypothetical protein